MCTVFAVHLIEVWQETFRAKFKTQNCSAFPSIFDCTNVNYSFLFTLFACIFVENNNHGNIGKHRSVFDDAIVDWWRWRRVECENSLYIGRWWKSKMSAKRTLYVRASSSRKKSSILGGGFLVISYHTLHKNTVVTFVRCSMLSARCAYKSFDEPCNANNQSPKAMSHTTHNENESFSPRICVK